MSGSSSDNDEWTVARVLSWATNDFRSKGFDSPRLDAELLLCAALECDRVRLITDSKRPLVGDELSHFKQLIQRRRKAEPIAYILGTREFFGLPIRVDKRVLIPRPETEILVETALLRTAHRSLYGQALDLFTGSGCVAIALARQRPTWRVTGSDVSEPALEVARENAHRLGAIANVNFRQSDLFSAFAESQEFSLITANPPYIPSADIAELQTDIRDFEPEVALDGGRDGLDFVRSLVDQAPRYLEQSGVLAVEIGHDQAERVIDMFTRSGFSSVEAAQDYIGHQRVVSGSWLSQAG